MDKTETDIDRQTLTTTTAYLKIETKKGPAPLTIIAPNDAKLLRQHYEQVLAQCTPHRVTITAMENLVESLGWVPRFIDGEWLV